LTAGARVYTFTGDFVVEENVKKLHELAIPMLEGR